MHHEIKLFGFFVNLFVLLKHYLKFPFLVLSHQGYSLYQCLLLRILYQRASVLKGNIVQTILCVISASFFKFVSIK